MRAMLNRIRRLEKVAAPAERERAAVEAILEARRRRLGADCEPMTFPTGSFAGCKTVATGSCKPEGYEWNARRPKRRFTAGSCSHRIGADNGELWMPTVIGVH